jgi:drug/metabolite transporter (DMT)-like permease
VQAQRVTAYLRQFLPQAVAVGVAFVLFSEALSALAIGGLLVTAAGVALVMKMASKP